MILNYEIYLLRTKILGIGDEIKFILVHLIVLIHFSISVRFITEMPGYFE